MMNLRRSSRTAARGFTLIEAVLGIVLLGILAMAAMPVITGGIMTYATTTTSLSTFTKLRYATERMAREVREVRRNPVTPANYDISTNISTGTTNALVFTKADGNQVSLGLSGSNVTLVYSTPAVSATLTDQASGLTFRYYQSDGTTAASSVANVAFVDIELDLTDSGSTITQRTRVGLRNQQ